MTFSVVVTDDAENDVEQAMDWYESKQTGLGKKYLFSITNCIKLIVKNPFAFAIIFLKIRKANIKKFPYSLYYQINENENGIIVFAVIHSSRSEEHRKKRINTT